MKPPPKYSAAWLARIPDPRLAYRRHVVAHMVQIRDLAGAPMRSARARLALLDRELATRHLAQKAPQDPGHVLHCTAPAGVQIPLSNGLFAVVDEADAEMVQRFTWHYKQSNRTGYAKSAVTVNGKKVYFQMHRLILDPPAHLEVDHIDGDGLNNRRSNLRACTRVENLRNCRTWGRSRYRGVWFDKSRDRWATRIRVNGRPINLGYYRDEVEAARAYDEAAKIHFGAFAKLNFSQRRSA